MAHLKLRVTGSQKVWRFSSRAAVPAFLVAALVGLPACHRTSLVDRAQLQTAPGHLSHTRHGNESALRQRALAHLAQQKPQAAVAVLRRWAVLEPGSAVAWSDLSAALLALTRRSGELALLLEALETSTRAAALDPGLEAARDNRRTSLRELGLVHEARDPSAIGGAGSPVDPMGARLTVYDWWRQQVDAAGGPPTVDQMTVWLSRAPGLARRHLEEQVLDAWSRAHRDGRRIEAERYRQSLELAARLLSERFGEHTLGDGLKALDRDPDAAARAHSAYTSGVTAYELSSFAEATRHLETAQRSFVFLRSPFADLAELYLGIMAFRTSPARAFTRLEALHQRLDVARSPWLVGRTAWLLGTLEGQEGQYRSALARYRQAAPLLRSSGDPALYAFTDTLIGEVLSFLDRPEAWTHRIRALRGLARHGHPRRRLAALQEAVNALEREDRLTLSLPFTDELIAHSRRWDNDLAWLSASWQKARVLVLSGRAEEAERSLSEARALADALGEGAMQDRELGELETVEALLEIERDPAAAAVTLSAALAKRRRIHFRYGEERILLWRARARRRSGDVAGAEQDLRQAIDRQTNMAADLPAVERVARLTEGRVMFSELVEPQGPPPDRRGPADLDRQSAGCRHPSRGSRARGTPRETVLGVECRRQDSQHGQGARVRVDDLDDLVPDGTLGGLMSRGLRPGSPLVIIIPFAALLAAPASFSQTACLNLGTARPCEGSEDSSACEAIRDQFCGADSETCRLEVVKVPSDGDLVYVLGPCRDRPTKPCIGLVERLGGIVVEPPTPQPDWTPEMSLIRNLSRVGFEDRFAARESTQPTALTADLALDSCSDVAGWPWAQLLRSVGSSELPRFASRRKVRLALIDGGISPFALEEIEGLGVRVSKGSSTHPVERQKDVVDQEAHLHGTQMASAIAKTLHRFTDLEQTNAVELVVYRSFIDNCAPAISLVRAIQDVILKEYEILVIAAEMRTANENIRVALLDAIDRGVLVVVAATNEPKVRIDAENQRFPASWNTDTDGLLVVSAVDASNGHVGARGALAVDLFAPGKDIPIYDATGGPDCGDGSSLAAAIVGALAAITLSQLPPDVEASGLERFLVGAAHKVTSLQGEARSGGVVDLAQSVASARAAHPWPPP